MPPEAARVASRERDASRWQCTDPSKPRPIKSLTSITRNSQHLLH